MAALQKITELIQTRQLEDGVAALRKFVRKKSNDRADWVTAHRLAAGLGDFDTALAAAKNAAALAPHDPQMQLLLIDALSSTAQHELAAKKARALQANPAAAADAYFLEGAHLARLGERDAAVELLRKAIAIRPDHTSAWEQLALIDGVDAEYGDIDAMKALLSNLRTPAALIPLAYALGRSFDRIGDLDAAFACFLKGSQLRQQAQPFNIAPLVAYLQRLQATFTRDLIDKLSAGTGGANLVFIVSAPRSGSTLIEQILATAPGVTPTGEHTLLRLATLTLGSMEPVDMARAQTMKPSDWRKMAQQFETSLRKRFGAGKAYTDKTMINYYYVGLIRILFPQARIIWLRRNPRDVAWSCFTSRIQGNEWAQTIEGCAQFLNVHNGLCRHWSAVSGGEMAEFSYEELASAPEAASTRLFEAVCLDRPAGWSEFYASKNAVATASLAQVRRPLNAGSVDRWRRYEKHLGGAYEGLFHD